MTTIDSSNPAGQCPLDLVEILKRLGAHRRAVYEQTYGKPLWTCEQSDGKTGRQLGVLRNGKPRWTREQSDAYFCHPLVRACEWLEERLGISRLDLEDAAFRLTTPLGLKGMEPLPSPDGGFLPEVKGQGKPVQLTEKQQAALAGLRPNCFQVISEEQAEALAQLPGRAVKRKRPSEGDTEIPDWLWMIPKFRELDRDGTTARLWQLLAKDCPTILANAGMLVPLGNGGGDGRSRPAAADRPTDPGQAIPAADTNGKMGEAEPAEATSKTKTPTKAKRSTERGEGRAKLIAALTKHHEYADGSCLNLEPVGNNELARLAEVSGSTASAFFKKQFDGHTKYRAICSDTTQLIAALKLLNQEYSPHHLFGAKPPGEDEREDEQ